MDVLFFENKSFFATHLQGEIKSEDSPDLNFEDTNLNFEDLARKTYSKNSNLGIDFLYPSSEFFFRFAKW